MFTTGKLQSSSNKLKTPVSFSANVNNVKLLHMLRKINSFALKIA